MANDNNANEQYSWMNDALDDNGVGSDGERFSELIADTVGGRTRAELAELQRQAENNRAEINRTQNQFYAEQQQQERVESRDRRPSDRAPSVVTLASRSSGGAGDNNNSNVSGTTSDGLSTLGRRIQQHPYPGDGAKRLLEMVQQPFFVRFGDRGLSSAREIEHHRAGSSTKPLISPFLKDAEPEILHDSPRRVRAQTVGTQTPAIPSALSRPASPSPRRTHSLSDYPPLYDFSRRPHIRPPSTVRTTPSIPDSVYRSSPTRRSHSLSDYPPLYDFSRRPQIRQGTLGSAYRNAAPDPNFYRRRFINSLLKDIRRNKDLVRKLEGRQEELDDACRRDAEELSIIRRERELLVRELELQSREHELEEYERRRVPPQPILKHSASFPPNGSSSGGSNSNNRVNFASPICTAKEYTPNNSSSLEVSGARMPPPSRVMTGVQPVQQPPPPRTGVQPVQQQKQHHQSGSGNGQRCKHPLHHRRRAVSSPAQNGHSSRRSRTPSPAPRLRAADVNREREQEQQRVAHEAEFRAVQQRAHLIAVDQHRRATAARRPAGGPPVSRRNPCSNPVNASSIFHFVPPR
uniref:Uncharacterized protein n=1 Tax=Globodera rostochiensis TaxID=31243 RepID=A0A914GNY3_GLORO